MDGHGLDYNTGPLHRQLGSVARKIGHLSLPDRVSRGLPTSPGLGRLVRLPFGSSQEASPVAPVAPVAA